MPKKTFLSTWARAGKFRRNRDGVVAIEFAFVILPFLAITLGTLEIAVVHLMRSSISNAVESASRPIYTGSAGCATVETVKTEICSHIAMQNETNCKANLKVVLEELTDFTGQRQSVDSDFNQINDFVDPGESESVMLLRTYYRWNIMFPLMSDALGGENGEILLGSNTAFRNEPYGSGPTCSGAT